MPGVLLDCSPAFLLSLLHSLSSRSAVYSLKRRWEFFFLIAVSLKVCAWRRLIYKIIVERIWKWFKFNLYYYFILLIFIASLALCIFAASDRRDFKASKFFADMFSQKPVQWTECLIGYTMTEWVNRPTGTSTSATHSSRSGDLNR